MSCCFDGGEFGDYSTDLSRKKWIVLLSTSLAGPAVAGCSRAETFSQLSSISFAQPCTRPYDKARLILLGASSRPCPMNNHRWLPGLGICQLLSGSVSLKSETALVREYRQSRGRIKHVCIRQECTFKATRLLSETTGTSCWMRCRCYFSTA